MLSSRNLLMLTGLGALLATLVLFAGVAMHQNGGATLPAADAAPETPTTTTATTATTSSSSTSSTAATTSSSGTTTTTTAGQYPTDTRGFVDSKARCDDGQSAVALGRTQRSLVVICPTATGGYQYRGVRVTDNATLQAVATAKGDGFEADTDGAVYSVTPTELVVTSGGEVIYRDTWIEYRQQPTFTTATTTTSATTTSSTATSSAAPKPAG